MSENDRYIVFEKKADEIMKGVINDALGLSIVNVTSTSRFVLFEF